MKGCKTCGHLKKRHTKKGPINYYYCKEGGKYMAVWHKEKDIRLVKEEEADAAMGWLVGYRVHEHMDPLYAEDRVNKVPSEDTPKAIDLFSGAGGLTLGMAQAGFNIVGHVENSDMANETYEHNKVVGGFPNSERICKDITTISDEEILKFKEKHGHIKLIMGSPPC